MPALPGKGRALPKHLLDGDYRDLRGRDGYFVLLYQLVLGRYVVGLRRVVLNRRGRALDDGVAQPFGVLRDDDDAHVSGREVLLDGAVHVGERELREPFAHEGGVLGRAVVAAVERVAEPRVLRRRQDVRVLRKEVSNGLEVRLLHPLAHELVVLVERGAQYEVRVLRLDGPNPDLEYLRRAPEVRVGRELEHAAREVFDVGVVAVVKPARLAESLVQVTHRRAVLAQIRRDERECGPVLVGARDRDWEAHRDGGRARLALDYRDAHPARHLRLRVTLRRARARG